MSRTSSSAFVPAGAEVVWATLSRFGEISQWGTGVDESSLLTAASDGVGATRRVQVGRNALRETITVWEPPRSLGYTILGLPPVVRSASNTWTLEPVGDGTRVTLLSDVTTRGGPLVGRLVVRLLGKAGSKLVAGLAANLARGAA
jgi:hypothetical protein